MPGSLLHRWQTSSMNFWHAIASKIWLAEMQNIKFRTPPGRQWTKILQFKAKRKTLEPLKFQGFLWSARHQWYLQPGSSGLLAGGAFAPYKRSPQAKTLAQGGIHFRRVCEVLTVCIKITTPKGVVIFMQITVKTDISAKSKKRRRAAIPNHNPAQRLWFGKDEQRRECALTFVKKSEQAIQSLLRRGPSGRLELPASCSQTLEPNFLW